MPWGDGTGPTGAGPMTGRAAGYYAGYSVPGYRNPILGGRGARRLPFLGRWSARIPRIVGYGRGYSPRGLGRGLRRAPRYLGFGRGMGGRGRRGRW